MKTWMNVSKVKAGETLILANQSHAVVKRVAFEFDPDEHAPVVRLSFVSTCRGNPVEDTLVPVDHSVLVLSTGCASCAAMTLVVSAVRGGAR